MSQALIVRDDAKLSIAFTESAISLKTAALEQAALIGKVDGAFSQQQAVEAQKSLSDFIKIVNEAEEEAKAPLNKLRFAIIESAREFRLEAIEEQLRLAELVGSFQQLEETRVRAAQQAENQRLTELERDKARELAKAETHEELDEIQERYNNLAKSEPIGPIRAEGQRVREVWEINVVDIWTLARAHPMCVRVEPLVSEISNLLDSGTKVSGVKAQRKIVAGVTSKKSSLIEV